jgi:sugar/nucleoside kinase (ribokinase family)
MTQKHSFDILVAGEINPDLILSGNVAPAFGQVEQLVDSAVLTIGSSSAIFACGAARLGLKVAFVGVCGADIFGRFMLDELSRNGVDISSVIVDPAQPTGLSVILNHSGANGTPGDRAILTHQGTIQALEARQVPPTLLQKARHLHIASYFLQTALQPGLPDLFRHARSLGLTTSLDTNWDPSGMWLGFDELLHLVDIFLPNENEALAISRATNLNAALQVLSQKSQVVAMKCGSEGGLARRGNEYAHTPALPVQVLDTVGAGDSFDAGFVYGWLKGWSLEKALRLAVTCGSLSTRATGGTSAQPGIEEAMKYL